MDPLAFHPVASPFLAEDIRPGIATACSALVAGDRHILAEDTRLAAEVVVAENRHNTPGVAVGTSPAEMAASVAEPSAAVAFDSMAVALAEEQQPAEAVVLEAEAVEVAVLRQQKHQRYYPVAEVLAGSRLAGLLFPDFVDLDYLTSWVFYGSSVCVAS